MVASAVSEKELQGHGEEMVSEPTEKKMRLSGAAEDADKESNKGLHTPEVTASEIKDVGAAKVLVLAAVEVLGGEPNSDL